MHESIDEAARTQRLVSIVVPVYNSPAIETLIARISEVFEGRPEEYEIIFVDDGSPDETTWRVLDQIAREDARVRAVQLSRNFGQHAATICGLREARGDIMITIDDDLQHDPRDIPLLLARANHDIVIGHFERKKHPFYRRLGSRGKAIFDEFIFRKPRHIQLSSFRLLSRTVVDGILSISTPHPFLPALMFHVSSDVVGVSLIHGERSAGRSGYTLLKLLRLFSEIVINNSSILLRVSASAGVIFSLVSFVLAADVIYRKIVHGIPVKGWTSLFASTLLIGGFLLLSLGVVGEYLIRIIESTEGRPMYFVRRRSG